MFTIFIKEKRLFVFSFDVIAQQKRAVAAISDFLYARKYIDRMIEITATDIICMSIIVALTVKEIMPWLYFVKSANTVSLASVQSDIPFVSELKAENIFDKISVSVSR